MNNASEHDIDRVLTALRDTEPSDGLEARILQALEKRTPVRSTWFRWTPTMQWGVAALATAAIVVAVALTAHTRHEKTTQPTVATTDPTPNPVISTEASRLHATRSGEIAAFTEASTAHTPAHLKSTRTSAQPAYPPHELLCDCDPVAMAEMQAPSHPAPEMPLTAQERLLQRVVHRGGAIEIAELELPQNHTLGRAVAAKEKEDHAVKNVVQSFLKQLAAAEAFNPTSPVADADDPGPSVESASGPN